MNMKTLLALLLVCCFAISSGFAVNALLPQKPKIEVASDLTLAQAMSIQPNAGGGGDPVPGPGVPR